MIDVEIPYEVVCNRYDEIVSWIRENVSTPWEYDADASMIYDTDTQTLYVAFSFENAEAATLFKLVWG
jgi:hypothetical protein